MEGTPGGFGRFADRLKNYDWYYYKWRVLASVFFGALALMFILPLFLRGEPDVRAAYVRAAGEGPDAEEVERALGELFAADGEKITVAVEETEAEGRCGRRQFYQALCDGGVGVYVMDGKSAELYRGLGFIRGETYLDGPGVWAAQPGGGVLPTAPN